MKKLTRSINKKIAEWMGEKEHDYLNDYEAAARLLARINKTMPCWYLVCIMESRTEIHRSHSGVTYTEDTFPKTVCRVWVQDILPAVSTVWDTEYLKSWEKR